MIARLTKEKAVHVSAVFAERFFSKIARPIRPHAPKRIEAGAIWQSRDRCPNLDKSGLQAAGRLACGMTKSDDARAIGARIRERRAALGLSQRDIAAPGVSY